MSEQVDWPNKQGLEKKIGNNTIHLGKSYSLVYGKGWYCRIITPGYRMGFGFHKKNKFTAYREALNNLNQYL